MGSKRGAVSDESGLKIDTRISESGLNRVAEKKH